MLEGQITNNPFGSLCYWNPFLLAPRDIENKQLKLWLICCCKHPPMPTETHQCPSHVIWRAIKGREILGKLNYALPKRNSLIEGQKITTHLDLFAIETHFYYHQETSRRSSSSLGWFVVANTLPTPFTCHLKGNKGKVKIWKNKLCSSKEKLIGLSGTQTNIIVTIKNLSSISATPIAYLVSFACKQYK